MEILKASEYEILATCGGMALCATCHVEVVEGLDTLPSASDQELDMLDTLPDADDQSRLACQLYLHNNNNGMKIKIKGATIVLSLCILYTMITLYIFFFKGYNVHYKELKNQTTTKHIIERISLYNKIHNISA
jgi:2Fe-2S ferredoxin